MAELFRKKSIEKTPENLGEQIKVSRPSVWIIIAAAAILLVGGLIWAVAGHLDTVITTSAIVSGNKAVILIPEENGDEIDIGMTVKIDGSEVSITSVDDEPKQYGSENAYALHLGGHTEGDWLYAAQAETTLGDGVYKAYVTTETVSPIEFLFN